MFGTLYISYDQSILVYNKAAHGRKYGSAPLQWAVPGQLLAAAVETTLKQIIGN